MPDSTSTPLAQIYKSVYDKELAAANPSLQARVKAAVGSDKVDREVDLFIQSVAFKAEEQYDKETAIKKDKKDEPVANPS